MQSERIVGRRENWAAYCGQACHVLLARPKAMQSAYCFPVRGSSDNPGVVSPEGPVWGDICRGLLYGCCLAAGLAGIATLILITAKALSGLTLMAFQVSTTFMQQLWAYKHILFPQKNATRTWILTTVQPSSSYLLFWWLPKCFDKSVSWERIAGFAMAANALSVRPPLRGPSHFLQSEINSCNIHNGKFLC